MTDVPQQQTFARLRPWGRPIVVFAASVVLVVAGLVTISSTFSDSAVQSVHTRPAHSLADAGFDDVGEDEVEHPALVVTLGDPESSTAQTAKKQTPVSDARKRNQDSDAESAASPDVSETIQPQARTTAETPTTTAAPTTAAPTTASPATPAPTDSPNMDGLSSAAIRVSFENHPVGGSYDTERQELDDWVDVSWNRHWSDRSVVVDSPNKVGDQAIRVTYPAGHHGGARAAWIIPPHDEYYLSYYIMFKDGFDFDGDDHSGGKLPGLAAGELCSGGQTCDGSNGFTARYMWREGGQAQLYLYDMDRDSGWGRQVYFESNGRDFYFETGKWHHLVQRVRTNSSPNTKDGLVQVWMNGEQVVDLGGLRFQTNGDQIDTFYFATFFGGSGEGWMPSTDSYAYYDDIVVSPNRADVGL